MQIYYIISNFTDSFGMLIDKIKFGFRPNFGLELWSKR